MGKVQIELSHRHARTPGSMGLVVVDDASTGRPRHSIGLFSQVLAIPRVRLPEDVEGAHSASGPQ